MAENALLTSTQGYFNLAATIAGKSSETQRKYLDWLKLFYREVLGFSLFEPAALPIEPFIQTVTPAAVEAWLASYAAKGHSKSGLGQARASVVFLARMLVLSKQASSSLWHDLRLVSIPDSAATAAYGESAGERGARWLAPQEVLALIDCVSQHKYPARSARDVALVWLMVTLGLRRDELAGLEWSNLNKRGGTWAIRIRGKRNKFRAVAMPQETILALQPWAELISGGQKTFPSGYIMRRITNHGKILNSGITGNAIWRIVTEAWARTGLPGDLAPHDLRRTAAAIALDAGAKEREIQQMLGHSSIETTMRYLSPMRENTATYRIAQALSRDNGFFDNLA